MGTVLGQGQGSMPLLQGTVARALIRPCPLTMSTAVQMGREVSSLDWWPCSAGSQKSEQNAQEEADCSPSRSCSRRRRLWGEVSPCVPLAFLRCCCCPKRSLLARCSEAGWVHSSRKAALLSVPTHSGTTYRPSPVTPSACSEPVHP